MSLLLLDTGCDICIRIAGRLEFMESQKSYLVLGQAFFCAHPKKTQGRQNSRKWKLKKKTQTQGKKFLFLAFFRAKRKKNSQIICMNYPKCIEI